MDLSGEYKRGLKRDLAADRSITLLCSRGVLIFQEKFSSATLDKSRYYNRLVIINTDESVAPRITLLLAI